VIPADAKLTERPELIKGDTQTLFPGMIRLSEHALINTKNKSHSVTAQITVPENGANGVIIAQGGNFGGWGLYCKDAKLKYVYNLLGLHTYTVEFPDVLASGDAQVQMDFTCDGGGLGKGGTAALYVDGTKVAEGRLDKTHPLIFSADSTAIAGEKGGTPISDDFVRAGNNAYNGTVSWVHIAVGDDSHDHYIDEEDRIRIAMSLQ
jgi:hypothetical protein